MPIDGHILKAGPMPWVRSVSVLMNNLKLWGALGTDGFFRVALR